MENLSTDQKVDIAVLAVNVLLSGIVYLLAAFGAVSLGVLFLLNQANPDLTEQPIQQPQEHHIMMI